MNPRLQQLHDYPFTKLRALLEGAAAGGDSGEHKKLLLLSVGEPQHPPPAFVREALVAALDDLQRYPATQGGAALREAIASWLCRRYGLAASAIDPARQVLLVQGTREALFAAAQFIVAPGSDSIVAMPAPFYQIYEGAAIMAGAAPLYLPCTADNHFVPQLDAVSDSDWQRCQMIYLCNPANPTGTVFDTGFYQQLLELADRHDFVVASDECYSEIYYDEQSPTPGLLQACATLGRDDFSNCLVFNSLSKRSNLAGLRSGFVAGDAVLIQSFLRYRTYHGSAMPLHHQAASIAAWQDEAHVVENRARYREKIAASCALLQGVLDFQVPAGGFCLWADCGDDDERFTRELYTREAVVVLPGSYLARDTGSGNPASGFLRLALVQPLDDCVEAAGRVARFAAGRV